MRNTPRTNAFVTGNSEATQDEYIELAEFCRTLEEELEAKANESDRLLSWLETEARGSFTGISFVWERTCEGDPAGFKFMRKHFFGPKVKSFREAIKQSMKVRMGEAAFSEWEAGQ